MKQFPKKYKPQDLRNWAKKYRDNTLNETNIDNKDFIFSPNFLPTSRKLSYKDFFLIYLKDFFNHKENIENYRNNSSLQTPHEQLFLISMDQLENLASSCEFFNKRNQTLPQVWVNKLERRISSLVKKNINANNKIVESYLSSLHKIYVTDTDLYLYLVEQFKNLREQWKIQNKTQIWYRSFDLQTSIPLQDITRKEETIPFYVLKYFIGAKCEALPVCVEDIDSCCGDVWLLVHPKDKRYNKYIWKNAIIPLSNRQIPIIWDENVNIALNNWIKRICPCSDQESIELAKKYWLPTDIYVFDKQWLYTEHIHEPAFIWQERSKYYNNIVWFIEDIWNLSSKWEKVVRIPYLEYIHERLTPYKIDELVVDLQQEKQSIIDKIFEKKLNFSFLNNNFLHVFNEIESVKENINSLEVEESSDVQEPTDNEELNTQNNNLEKFEKLKTKLSELKQEIVDEIDKYLPDSIVCNSQIAYGRKVPLIKDEDWNLSYFNIEKDCLKRKEKPLQFCFNFVLLCLIRAWVIWIKKFWNKEQENKLCEFDKIFALLSQNERKIRHIVQLLISITWEKDEYNKFIEIIQNLTDENRPSIEECTKLIKDSKFIQQEWNRLLTNIQWIQNDTIDPYFSQLCLPCYLNYKNININDKLIFSENERSRIFKELAIQELILWDNISHNFLEYTYTQSDESLWNKQLSKTQIEQSQWDIFSLYWENPTRLNFLVNETYDPKEILLNNIFLKQIRNAVRLCVQKDFLPKDIKKQLSEQPDDFENFDLSVLYKLNGLYSDLEDIKAYEQYIRFFNSFKRSVQDIFFSWYLEILKVHSTKNVQFVCSYFFNFLLSILYPIVPEFVDALQYVSERDFLLPIEPIKLNKSIDYNMDTLYDTFIKIKNIKIECNIKQHEPCNIFIKSNPSIWDFFMENEQIFKNYFHISDINYLRLHEQTPLWYEIFYNDTVSIWIQPKDAWTIKEKDSIESLERDIKNLEDKLILLRQRIQFLQEWDQRKQVEEEYAKVKEEMENLTIKHRLLSSK